MSFALQESVQIYRHRQGEDYLLVSGNQSFKINANVPSVMLMMEAMILSSHNRSSFEVDASDPVASALVSRLSMEQILLPRVFVTEIQNPRERGSSVAVLSNSSTARFEKIFDRAGIAVVSVDIANCAIVISSPYDSNYLRKQTEFLIERGMRGLFGVVDYPNIEVGPYVIPDQSACYACAQQRTASAMRHEMFDRSNWIALNRPAHSDLAEELLCLLLVSAVEGRSNKHSNVLINETKIVNIESMQFSSFPIRRLPRCESCGIAGNAFGGE